MLIMTASEHTHFVFLASVLSDTSYQWFRVKYPGLTTGDKLFFPRLLEEVKGYSGDGKHSYPPNTPPT